jgi:cytidine deaminase
MLKRLQGLCLCAERSALAAAFTAGAHSRGELSGFTFTALACATADGGTSCGACRQLLREYCPPDMPVVFLDGNNAVVHALTVGGMLPTPFVLQ